MSSLELLPPRISFLRLVALLGGFGMIVWGAAGPRTACDARGGYVAADDQLYLHSGDPRLSAEDVVLLQLVALMNNDAIAPDGGIRVAFQYASASNRAYTGPLWRFARMVHGPTYAPLLEADGFVRLPLVDSGGHAEQLVKLVAEDGSETAYRWTLTRYGGGAGVGAWLTDSVMPVSPALFDAFAER
jgi:hypothetical protein